MVEITKIVEQNPWWKFGGEFVSVVGIDKSMDAFRDATLQIERNGISINPSNIYAIHGPRQAGKTTKTKQIVLELIKKGIDPDSICYFSCETLISRKELRKVLDFFIDKLTEHAKIYIFLDEINFVKDWVPEIKRIADSAQFNNVTILFTGSPLGIKAQTHEFMGRNIEGNRYFMKPLSFRDFVIQICKKHSDLTSNYPLQRELRILPTNLLPYNSINLEQPIGESKPIFKKMLKFTNSLNFLFDIYLKTGGFPAVINKYLRNIREKERVPETSYEGFIDIVIKDTMKQGKNERIMQQVLSAIIKKIGSRYDFRSITKETEEHISHPTTISYLELLEDNFLIHILYSYDFSNKLMRYKGAKKIYFADPFIFHTLNSWLYGKPGYSFSEEFLLKETNNSLIIESIVQNQLAKIKEIPITKPSDRFLWFYYDIRKEIDFVYQKENGEYLGIEVKYQPEVSFKDATVIDPIKEYLILSKNEFGVSENMVVVPVPIFLSLLRNSQKNL